jgi:diguanylate cyclase (GGDEF)-like protein
MSVGTAPPTRRSSSSRRPRRGIDRLTGLPNRQGLSDLLGHALSWRRRPGELVAVLYLDIDRFRELNEKLGRSNGDALLQAIGARLGRCLRGSDFVAHAGPRRAGSIARPGSDEFAIVLSHVDRTEGAAIVARRIALALGEGFRLGARMVSVTASIGIAIQHPEGEESAGLLERAEAAMHLAKADRRSSFRFYSEALDPSFGRRFELASEIREAIERGEFSLCYQPLVDSRSRTLVGVEALLRWDRPGREPIAPAEFVPVAEESGLMVALGEWVLRRACGQMQAWTDEGLPPLQLSVNLSSCQLREADFAATVAAVLKETGFEPGQLQIELTESGVIAQDARTLRQLERLKDLGVSLAIDDFGTGYSALGYLRRFPVDVIKIDRSFVGAISASPHDAAFVSAVIAMARRLDLTVVAEGVETAEQLAFLTENACDQAQGFLFSEPLPPKAFRQLLSREAAVLGVPGAEGTKG